MMSAPAVPPARTSCNAVVHVIRAEEDADGSGVFQPANAPT